MMSKGTPMPQYFWLVSVRLAKSSFRASMAVRSNSAQISEPASFERKLGPEDVLEEQHLGQQGLGPKTRSIVLAVAKLICSYSPNSLLGTL